MSAFAIRVHRPAVLADREATVAHSLSLQRTTTGWALFDERDRVIFEAAGVNGRPRCLAHARSLGVLRLTSGAQPSSR